MLLLDLLLERQYYDAIIDTCCCYCGCKLWVKNGKTGYLVPPSEPLRLAKVIKNMILEPNEIKKVGLAGRKIISDYNDYQTEMAKMENLYKLVF